MCAFGSRRREEVRMPKGDQHRKKTHCPQGHPYAGDNLLITKKFGYRQCRTCLNERARKDRLKPHRALKMAQYEKDNALLRRDQRLRRVYKITLTEFLELASKQDGRCAVCRLECAAIGAGGGRGVQGTLVVDHDHANGAVRGLLCHRCNKVLGLVYDSSDLLESLSRYVQSSCIPVVR